MLQVFGPYAAQAMAAAMEQPMAECLSDLDIQLSSLAHLLGPIREAVAVSAVASSRESLKGAPYCMHACMLGVGGNVEGHDFGMLSCWGCMLGA